jgi:hypothetical protein
VPHHLSHTSYPKLYSIETGFSIPLKTIVFPSRQLTWWDSNSQFYFFCGRSFVKLLLCPFYFLLTAFCSFLGSPHPLTDQGSSKNLRKVHLQILGLPICDSLFCWISPSIPSPSGSLNSVGFCLCSGLPCHVDWRLHLKWKTTWIWLSVKFPSLKAWVVSNEAILATPIVVVFKGFSSRVHYCYLLDS